jgi:hypothetical protein
LIGRAETRGQLHRLRQADEQWWDEFLGRLDQILEAQEGGR